MTDILIVDDTPANLTVLRQILTKQGYRVRPALSGEIALKAIEAGVADLILLDIMMPGMNGFEVCNKLKSESRTRDIPVIFISALNEAEDRVRGFQAGGVDFISKPFHAEEVLARVETHLMLRNIHLKLLDEVEEHKQTAIALEEANHELERMASIDGLTKIANRRRFDRYLQFEWKRLRRDKVPVSVILCDIDYFKLYNDAYGHVAGDKCLKQVAQGISRAVKRPGDLVARYGGEEFAVLLSNTDINGAVKVAKEIAEEVGKLRIPHSQSKVSKYLSVSMGVSSTFPEPSNGPELFVNHVDQFLYQAKEEGRNRIIASEFDVCQRAC